MVRVSWPHSECICVQTEYTHRWHTKCIEKLTKMKSPKQWSATVHVKYAYQLCRHLFNNTEKKTRTKILQRDKSHHNKQTENMFPFQYLIVNILRFAKQTENIHTPPKTKTPTGAKREEEKTTPPKEQDSTTDRQMKYKNIVRNAQQKLSVVKMKLIKN